MRVKSRMIFYLHNQVAPPDPELNSIKFDASFFAAFNMKTN